MGYIARDNIDAANRVYNAAEETFSLLVSIPEIGAVFSSKKVKLVGLRFFPIKRYANYVVYYRSIKAGIEIVRVLHSKAKKENHL